MGKSGGYAGPGFKEVLVPAAEGASDMWAMEHRPGKPLPLSLGNQEGEAVTRVRWPFPPVIGHGLDGLQNRPIAALERGHL